MDKVKFLLYNEIYNLYIFLYPTLARFPKSEKFTLRKSIDETVLDMLITLERYTKTKYKDKSSQIRKISYLFDKFKVLLKISKDLNFISINNYAVIVEKYEIIGKLIGGLLKKVD